MVYDISNPTQPAFVEYKVVDGDYGPEGLTFVSAKDSPINCIPLLIVTNEVGSTTTIYKIHADEEESSSSDECSSDSEDSSD